MRAVRDLGYDAIVGVHSDADVEAYRRSPLMTMPERVAAVEKYVSEVIPEAPTVIEEEFMERHKIDMVFDGHTEAQQLYGNMFESY